MFFPVKTHKFWGILRRYTNTGYPKIELLPSSTSPARKPEDILGLDNLHWVSGINDGLNVQFVVRIVSGVLRITSYSIKSHNTDTYYMRAWSLEGSNDNNNYSMIDDRPQNDDLCNSGIGQYPVNPQNNYYQYFRIKQTMPNKGDSIMRIFNLDFYGEFLPFKLNSCKYLKNSNNNMLSLLVSVIILSR